jgi:cytochrome c oxidase assembly factor CtaG
VRRRECERRAVGFIFVWFAGTIREKAERRYCRHGSAETLCFIAGDVFLEISLESPPRYAGTLAVRI